MALGAATALVLAVLVVVHSGHHILGVRVHVLGGIVDQGRLVVVLEVLWRLVVEAGYAVLFLGVGAHGGLIVQLALLEGNGAIAVAVYGHRLGEALRVVLDGAVLLHRLEDLRVIGHGHRHVLGKAVRPARLRGQPGHIAALRGEVGRGGLGGPGADGIDLLVVGQRLAVGIGQIGQGLLLVAEVVDAGAHLHGYRVAGAHVAVGPHLGPEGGQQAVVLHELLVGGIVGRRQLEDDGLAAMAAHLHVVAVGQILRVVHVGLAEVGVLAVCRPGSAVAVPIVVGLHAHAHGPAGLHQLLGGQALVLHRLLLALGIQRLARIGVAHLGLAHEGRVGVAVAIGALHIEGEVVALVVGEQALVLIGRAHGLAEVLQLLLPVEGHLLGQVQGEHELAVEQRAFLALVARGGLVADDGVLERGRQPDLVVVLEGALLRIRIGVGQLLALGRPRAGHGVAGHGGGSVAGVFSIS